ncbi:prepilin-type N-terminal cleavage/methylation domain-containing protein [Candidatus Omnitrophota bacterium]
MPVKSKTPKRLHKRSLYRRGFTLIEIMVTVVILSFGILAIYESLFISLDAFNYYSNYLNAQRWANEKVWELQNQLLLSEPLTADDNRGAFTINNKNFNWSVSIKPIDMKYGLYKLDVSLFWQEGSRERFVYRGAFATTQITQESQDAS